MINIKWMFLYTVNGSKWKEILWNSGWIPRVEHCVGPEPSKKVGFRMSVTWYFPTCTIEH
jgi:hypothetical protein